MTYLDPTRLEAFEVEAFRRRKPFPWANPAGLLTDAGYRDLVGSLPDVSRFERCFGKPRKYGQKSHDRFALEWRPGLDLPDPWRGFIAELHAPAYRAFVARLLGRRHFELRLHWHYAPNGCSVSPHCDARRKLGSHIFYLNTSEDWSPEWGGETLVLDDGGRFHSDSNRELEEFVKIEAARSLDNRSLLFARKGDSWHAVREVRCPPGRMRKVFIAVFEKPGFAAPLRRVLGTRRAGV